MRKPGAAFLILVGACASVPALFFLTALVAPRALPRIVSVVAGLVTLALLGVPFISLDTNGDKSSPIELFLRACVCSLMFVMWLVVGTAVWSRMVVVAAAALSIEVFRAAFSGRPGHGAVSNAFGAAIGFFPRGFEAIADAAFAEGASNTPGLHQVSLWRVAVECAWAIFFWAATLAAIGVFSPIAAITRFITLLP